MGRIDNRRVEQQPTNISSDAFNLVRSHAEQHLEFDPVADPTMLTKQLRQCNVKEIVASDAIPHRMGTFGSQRPVQNSLVVGVSGKFGRPRGLLPPVNLGIYLLHREIGALDQPHFDPRPTGSGTTVSPLNKTLQSGQRVGQVGLKDNASLHMTQFGAVKELLEDFHCQIKVVIFLHVEVDELRLRGVLSQVVQRQQLLNDLVDRRLVSP